MVASVLVGPVGLSPVMAVLIVAEPEVVANDGLGSSTVVPAALEATVKSKVSSPPTVLLVTTRRGSFTLVNVQVTSAPTTRSSVTVPAVVGSFTRLVEMVLPEALVGDSTQATLESV